MTTILAQPFTPEYASAVRGITAPQGGLHHIVAYNVAAVDDPSQAARNRVRAGLRSIGDPEWAPHIEPLPFAMEFAALRHRVENRGDFARRLPDAWVDQLAVADDPPTAAARAAALGGRGVTALALISAGSAPRACLAQRARVLSLVRDLYEGCGLSLHHIELLTGRPTAAAGALLRTCGIQLRPAGGRSPFKRRWREDAS